MRPFAVAQQISGSFSSGAQQTRISPIVVTSRSAKKAVCTGYTQFREHGQLGHTASLFDVETHVPMWIDAPPGTLTAPERAGITSYADAATFHSDITPTILDLMGLWDTPGVAGYKKQMVGGSLLRAGKPDVLVTMTNCAGVWGCAFQNWGVMLGFRKAIAREWDKDWLCYDVIADPKELKPLDHSQCADLIAAANRIHKTLPGRGD